VDIHADNFSTSGTTRNGFAPMVFEMMLDLDQVANGSEPDFYETFCNASGPISGGSRASAHPAVGRCHQRGGTPRSTSVR
jgi:hypothetical protein